VIISSYAYNVAYAGYVPADIPAWSSVITTDIPSEGATLCRCVKNQTEYHFTNIGLRHGNVMALSKESVPSVPYEALHEVRMRTIKNRAFPGCNPPPQLQGETLLADAQA
jgi:hypothetical protein